MRQNHPQPVENYTDAFFATAGGILFMVFWLLAALAGFLWVAATATALNVGIGCLKRRRMSRN